MPAIEKAGCACGGGDFGHELVDRLALLADQGDIAHHRDFVAHHGMSCASRMPDAVLSISSVALSVSISHSKVAGADRLADSHMPTQYDGALDCVAQFRQDDRFCHAPRSLASRTVQLHSCRTFTQMIAAWNAYVKLSWRRDFRFRSARELAENWLQRLVGG